MLGAAGCIAPEILGKAGLIPEATNLAWFASGVIPPAGSPKMYWTDSFSLFYIEIIAMQVGGACRRSSAAGPAGAAWLLGRQEARRLRCRRSRGARRASQGASRARPAGVRDAPAAPCLPLAAHAARHSPARAVRRAEEVAGLPQARLPGQAVLPGPGAGLQGQRQPRLPR
jgi:hypothetical protein